MIPLTYLTYDLPELSDKTLERLKWTVDQSDYEPMNNWIDWFTTPMTQKTWVGEIDDEHMQFALHEPIHLFNWIFHIVVIGRLEQGASGTKVKLKLGIGLFAVFWFAFVLIGGLSSLMEAWIDANSSITGFSLFLIIYSTAGTLLIRRRIKRAEENLDQIFA